MYAGLTTADKGTLLDVKARGAEWVIAQWGGKAFGYKEKPKREEITDECCYGSYFEWSAQDGDYEIELGSMPYPLVSYQNTEPVNIDIALAQIAEMESNEKALLSEKASEKGCAEMESAEKQEEIGCEFCKHYAKPSVVIWDSHVLAMVGEDKPHKPFIKIELKARKNEAELVAVSQGLDNKQNSVVIPIRHCPNCGRNLASPYTEGENI